jgi:integrase
MSIEPKWAQWDRDAKTFDLNPAGRKQTRKFRATVPVVDLLNRWLVDLEASDCPWFIRHNGQPIRSVHTAWNRMCDQLDLPREWNAKIIRHSMAAELRKRRVDAWELEGFMGHRKPSETETYAAYDPAYLGTVGAGICDIVSDLCASVPKALHPRYTQNSGKIAAIFPKKKEA